MIYLPYEYALTGCQKANDVVDLIKSKMPSISAVESGIDIGQGIHIGPRVFGHIGPTPFSLTSADLN